MTKVSLTTSPETTTSATGDSDHKRLLWTVAIGNMLIWFDIAIYGFFALYISRAFFPSSDPTLALLLTFAMFAVSFLVRPLGSLVLGAYADRIGPKRSLVMSAGLMSGGAAAVAVMPNYDAIGLVAPGCVLVARMVQGFAAGGEFGSSTAMLAAASKTGRGFSTSWQLASQMLSGALAAAFAATLTGLLSPEAMQEWGWRVPFAFGTLVAPVGVYIRLRLPDIKLPGQAIESRPAHHLVAYNKTRLATATGLVAVSTGVTYLLTFLPTYAVQTLSLPPLVGLLGVMLAFLVQIPITLISGALSDRFGRTWLMSASALALLLTFFPAFLLLAAVPSPTMFVCVTLWFAIVKGAYSGPLAAAMIEVLPSGARATGTALSYNLAVTTFGVSGPFMMTWLGHFTQSQLAPALYMSLLALVSLSALLAMRILVGRGQSIS